MFPRPAKIDAIITFPRPLTKADLQPYLGFINFYHCFIPKLPSILAPLHALQSSVKAQRLLLEWSAIALAAFVDSKLAAGWAV